MKAIMGAIRRALAALMVAALMAAALRVRGRVGLPREAGGWRPLGGPGMR